MRNWTKPHKKITHQVYNSYNETPLTMKPVACLAANRRPLTANQRVYSNALRNRQYDVVIVSGVAGSGKTQLAVDVGVELLQQKSYRKIVVTRPIVASNDQDLGFMPGGLKDKMMPWVAPIYDAVSSTNTSVQKLESDNKLEIIPFAFMRGRTFKDSWIICDEAQNCNAHQILMLLTRIGENSKMIMTGDPSQCDVRSSGFYDLVNKVAQSQNPKINEKVALIHMQAEDVVRHELIPHLIDLHMQPRSISM